MDYDVEALTQEFLRESSEGLSAMEDALVALEIRPNDAESLGVIFRIAHTMKGNAIVVGFPGIGELAHALEDLLEKLREKTLPVTPALVSMLLAVVDLLRRLIPEAAAGDEASSEKERNGFLARLRAFTNGDASAALPPSPGQGAASWRTSTLRVDVAKLDHMLNLSSEIAIARGRLGEMLEHEGRYTREQIVEAHRLADRLYLDLQEQVIKVRMVPVGPVFRQLNRVVRDLALSQKKQARLVIEGADVEVDMTVMEHLRDPLSHMIRNAIDHGLESAEARVAAGKDPCGTILLRASHESGGIVIRLSDDGAGLDRVKIAAQAKSTGIAPAPEKLADADLLRLVFEPGFSTKDEVTDISGRGVGMDVVRRNIEALHGTVSLASEKGRGTTITMRLPLTLAMIQGFAVTVGEETFVLPLDAVTECLELPPSEMTGAREGYLNLRGEPLPYLRLREVFQQGGEAPAREGVVVVRHDGRHAGLVVDTFVGESQTVIKPLGDLFRNIPSVSGSAILGTGRVALILDIDGLFKDALSREIQTHSN